MRKRRATCTTVPDFANAQSALQRCYSRLQPPRSQRRWCAHEVALGELQAGMAQEVVGGAAEEIEVRQDEVEQQRLPGELALVRAELEHDVLVLGAVDLLGLEALAEVDRLGEADLELRERRLGVGHVRHRHARKRAHTARRMR